MTEALALIIGYLIGSIPTGYLAGRIRGIDIRAIGSGSMGATNVFRAMGAKVGAAVLAVDVLKGLAAVLAGGAIAGSTWGILAGALAMVGHAFPVWLRFKGGKGVATGLGVVFGIVPLAAALVIPVWVAIVYTTRLVSVASICAALTLPAVAYTLGADTPETVFTVVAGIGVIALHHKNIGRLARGEELAVSWGKRD
ncbi:MAG: glycerol-3-phosphate 1-O-acyltransferase PlsY [Thermoleophilia bacterium]|nr:glycerol-3-phosphate 1-O-acyltransferase PlsY [Thermoleophilia bacterium]MDH3724209.1 glycerol-3-phosphate 1-O-acyltransferase PlsY [Thermoleophilia bacterium]